MKLPRRRHFLHLAAGAAALPAVSRFAWAQSYPTRPVRIVVGLTAGSASDLVARLVGQWLSERLGQPFVIENRPGAGSNIAAEGVVRMKTLVGALTVVAVLIASAFMQAADAQQSRKPRPDDPERLRMIRECMEMNRKYNTDPFGRTGGKEHMYHACMANHGHYH
jgi:tripartite-type tricarboxylate transporter receptor subunit TctC